MNTIVVGAVGRYDWKRIFPWWKSLKMTGFQGEIHMLVYEVDSITLRKMQEAGIIVHLCKLQAKQIVVGRFHDLAELCKTFAPDDWVVFPDVGDIVFQMNPADFLAKVDADVSIVVASEGIRFKGNQWALHNLLESFPEHYANMHWRKLYNAGSVAAKAGWFHILASETYELCMTKPDAKSHDQAAMNIVLREDHKYNFETLWLDANEGWCFCAASSIFAKPEDKPGYYEAPPVIKDGKCYVEAGLSVMFHHYTRDAATKRDVLKWVNAK